MLDRFVAFDLEMPGQHEPRISAIGITVVENSQVTDKKYFLVNPECDFDPYVIKLIGITPEMVADKPTFPEVWEQIKDIMSSGLLVAHGAPGDMKTLCGCLRDYGIEWQDKVRYACTCDMGIACYPHLEHYSLDVMCEHIGFDLNHHHALSDSEGCAMLFLHYLENGINPDDFVKEFDAKQCHNVKKVKIKKDKKKSKKHKFVERVTWHLMSMRTDDEFFAMAEAHPEIDPDRIMGVSRKKLWGYATEVIRKNQRADYLKTLPHYYYEENLLHAILIARSNKYSACVRAINYFLPHIENMEICLNMLPRIFNRKPPELAQQVDEWLKSDNIYAKGFALAVIVKCLPDRKYTKLWQESIEAIETDNAEINRLKDEFRKRIRKSKKEQTISQAQEQTN